MAFFGFTGLASFIAALFTGLFIGTMFLTRFADRFGRRTMFTYSLVWYSVCTTVVAFQSTADMLNLWRLLAGVGLGVELVTVDTYISELVPKQARGRTFAIEQAIGFVAVPVATLLAWILCSPGTTGPVRRALGRVIRRVGRDPGLDGAPTAAGIATLARAARPHR